MTKSMRSTRSILAATACAIAVSGCAVTTPTYGTGESVEMGVAKDLAGLATFGLAGRKKKKPITYKARAPLVIPEGTAPKKADDEDAAPVETAAVDPNGPTLKFKNEDETPFLQRVGIKKRKYTSRSDRLVDVPQDYRIVEATPDDAKATALVNGTKKKKKKRFGIF